MAPPEADGDAAERAGAGGAVPAPRARAGTGRRIADLLVAPGAARGEVVVTFAAAVLGAGLALAGAGAAGWSLTAAAVAAIIAFDYAGGATANATGAAKRRFHGPHRRWPHHLGFVAAHVQPLVAAWAVPGLSLAEGAAVYLATLGAAVGVVAAPERLRRPAAFAATAVGVTAAAALLDVPPAIAWLAPVGLVKLLLGHLLPEAPGAVPEPPAAEAAPPGATAAPPGATAPPPREAGGPARAR
ncbi:hypothetical protein LG943_23050 [Streptomonospora sp. S1-112]|uniref:Uncharacterized protein n=1 Tax=Streptomonospora mangrovi TaxID=2883123 RepID=A0A9X3NPP2_9ACTN|nr:hypothetical protein [Streptomonospora mangrovi]MDA0567173.1 hypothetical protein [Streptomonospora mangrovi]